MVCYFFDIETTGLNPYQHIILTIQFKKDDSIVIWKLWEEEDEVSILHKFLKYVRNIKDYEAIYGYNCLKFDLPFISTKLILYNTIDSNNYKMLYDKKWIDLYQYLGGNHLSIDRWLQYLGIKRRCPFRGRDIPHLYEEKRLKDIEEHAKEDLILCEKLVRKLIAQKEETLMTDVLQIEDNLLPQSQRIGKKRF